MRMKVNQFEIFHEQLGQLHDPPSRAFPKQVVPHGAGVLLNLVDHVYDGITMFQICLNDVLTD